MSISHFQHANILNQEIVIIDSKINYFAEKNEKFIKESAVSSRKTRILQLYMNNNVYGQ